MKNSRTLSPQLLTLLALGMVTFAGYAPAASQEPVDRVIIQWRTAPPDSDTESRATRRISARTGQPIARSQRLGGRLSVLQLDKARSGLELNATLAALRSDPEIELVEPDRRVHAHAFAPSDPLFAGQWYMQSVQPAATRAESAWDITHGGTSPATATIVVAVLDTGVRFEHPDLRRVSDNNGKLLPGYDFVSGESATSFGRANDGDGWDPDPSDPGDFLTATDLANAPFKDQKCGDPLPSSWHGTRVAGMIAADTDNALGVAGTGFNVRILPVRVLGKCGGFDSDVIAGMYWAAGMPIPPPFLLNPALPVNPTPAQIINMSLGGVGPCSAIYASAVRDITARGVLIVVSAGNEGGPVDSPANCPGAMGVAGLRHVGTKVGYSNLGAEVGIAAPAGNCVNLPTLGDPDPPCLFSLDTTTNDGVSGPGSSTYTNQLNQSVGTSFAAPQVAGTASLMKAVNPALTPALLIARIKSTAREFPKSSDNAGVPACITPTTDSLQKDECICNKSFCGAGMLDAAAAVVAALRPVALAKVDGTVSVGHMLTLDGSQSGASVGRTLTVYNWTVIAAIGGASTPNIQSPGSAVAQVLSPTSGSYSLRLTITDSAGATDSVDLTIDAATSGGGTVSASPPPETGHSGGGSTSPDFLILLSLLALTRRWRTNAGFKWI
ncbi:MAG: S8 family serine peptidase [Pseudomonadota bacterium]